MKLKSLIIPGVIAILMATLWIIPSKDEAKAHQKTVAITQIVDHPSLNQARAGLLDALQDAGFVKDDNLQVLYQTPQGNLSVGAQIAKSYNQLKPDAIVAISTTSAQTVLASNQAHLPIVFSSVTDPLSAKLISNLEHPGADITGTMEAPPIEALLLLADELLPQAKTIGVIYNPGEANSVNTIKLIEKLSKYKVLKATVLNSADITQSVNSLIDKVDVLILPSDNTVWSALDKLISICNQHQVPVLTCDPDSANKGVMVALGYAQYDIGYDAGKKVARILQGENPGNIPVSVPNKLSLYINLDSASKVNMTISESLLTKADKVISTNEARR